jgi:NCAIR mutase (PurE)-related protein
MHPDQLRQLAQQLLGGQCDVEQFVMLAAAGDPLSPGEPSAPAAVVDVDRARRCGFPEVIFGEGKTAATIAAIAQQLLDRGQSVLATRIDGSKATALQAILPSLQYNELGRTVRIDVPQPESSAPSRGRVAVITAGTSDLPIAEEACETLAWMGVDVTLVQDVGVAGPHRLPSRLAQFADSDAVVVVAGMEGALPSVVGGYVACPVFAVPTSVGYGANFGGVSALLSMLNSCAANVAVVNIDAGFKAGYLAGLVATRIHQPSHSREAT